MSREPLPITLQKLARAGINAFAYCGVVSIIYGMVSRAAHQPWPIFEAFATRASSSLTIAGCALTAGSLYVWRPGQDNHPEDMSKFTAPVALAACLVAAYYLTRGELPVTVTNGFAIVGLAGSLLRIQPNPYHRAL